MPTYREAAEFFEANVTELSPKKDKALWNLNSGLLALCQALEANETGPMFCEADSLMSRLDSIERALRHLQEGR